MNYGNVIKSGEAPVAVWGTGYIGYSTMAYFGAAGVRCVGYDVDQARVAQVNAGELPVPGIEGWLEVDPRPLVAKGLVSATASADEPALVDALVHFIAVPTERGGRPYWKPLEDVVGRIARILLRRTDERPPLVIIESTLTPGTTERLIEPMCRELGITLGVDLLLGIAPRRDWFVRREQSLRNLDRIYSGTDARSADETHAVLGLVCERLHRASNHEVGELVKCVENAYRQMDITLANQLCLAYPGVDMAEVLALAGTKWNMGQYHPSFGTGGYCIPLSSQYVLDGAQFPDELTLLRSTLDTDFDMRRRVAEAMKVHGCRRVGVLGLAYRGDLKVSIMSPTILIVRHLQELGIDVRVCDPYYTPEELERETGAPTFRFPDQLDEFDGLLLTTDHRAFLSDVQTAVLARARDLVILDNYGAWAKWPWPAGSRYFRAGGRGWLGTVSEAGSGRAAAAQ